MTIARLSWRMCVVAFAAVTTSIAFAQAPKLPLESIADAKGCKIWDQTIPPQSAITWSGACKNGFADGKGILQWSKSGNATDRYEGEFKNGYYDGYGSYFWEDGARYDGHFKRGLFEGKAVHTYPNGNRFVGEYENDRRIHGTMTFASGARYEGDWSDSVANGTGTLKAADGQVYSGRWTNGCFVQGNRRAAVGVPLDKCR